MKIGNDVILTVLSVERGKVRIGFDAPKAVKIWRTEILEPRKDARGQS